MGSTGHQHGGSGDRFHHHVLVRILSLMSIAQDDIREHGVNGERRTNELLSQIIRFFIELYDSDTALYRDYHEGRSVQSFTDELKVITVDMREPNIERFSFDENAQVTVSRTHERVFNYANYQRQGHEWVTDETKDSVDVFPSSGMVPMSPTLKQVFLGVDMSPLRWFDVEGAQQVFRSLLYNADSMLSTWGPVARTPEKPFSQRRIISDQLVAQLVMSEHLQPKEALFLSHLLTSSYLEPEKHHEKRHSYINDYIVRVTQLFDGDLLQATALQILIEAIMKDSHFDIRDIDLEELKAVTEEHQEFNKGMVSDGSTDDMAPVSVLTQLVYSQGQAGGSERYRQRTWDRPSADERMRRVNAIPWLIR